MMSGYQPQGEPPARTPRGSSSARRSDRLVDLAERLAEVAGAAHLVANVLGTAAVAAGEMAEASEPAIFGHPAEIATRFVARDEAGSFSISPVNGAPIAYAETQAAADRIVAALNLLAAIEENANAPAQR